MMEKNSLSIYVHIPFCVRKCNYCDFLSFNAKNEVVDAYFEALKKEIGLEAAMLWGGVRGHGCRVDNGLSDTRYVVQSIFFGGGTPSFVDSERICDTLGAVKSSFNVAADAEITIEVNPASAMYEKLAMYRQAGFNRISIGAQSLNDDELKMLGRAHNSAMFYETFENAGKAGFDNINVDVMSALPGQSLDSYCDTLKKVVALGPSHISAYSLIIEEGTPFYDMELALPDEDTDRTMYHETKRILDEAGYHRYEISNYALPGRECYHNKVYWKRGNYLGLGLGAASMADNVRWSNVRELDTYIRILSGKACEEGNDSCATSDELISRKPGEAVDGLNAGANYYDGWKADEAIDVIHANVEFHDDRKVDVAIDELHVEVESLSLQAQMEEFMFLGLRLVDGVSVAEFRWEFGKEIWQVYGEVIDKYIGMGLLEYYENGDSPALLSCAECTVDESTALLSCAECTVDDSTALLSCAEHTSGGESATFLRLTDAGLNVSNTVMAEFLL